MTLIDYLACSLEIAILYDCILSFQVVHLYIIGILSLYILKGRVPFVLLKIGSAS